MKRFSRPITQPFGPTPTPQEIAAWIGNEANATPVFATGGLVSTNPTPIFDQLVAESDPDLFLAGHCFPQVVTIKIPARNAVFTDWMNPTNLGSLA